jgi:hypothetical protein
MTDAKSPAELADQAAEAIRALNHKLISGGLTYPADAYDTIGTLRTLADRLPQSLGLIARWLGQEHDRGAIGHDSGGDAGEYILATADALGRAQEDAELLAAALDVAQQAAGGLKAVS